MVCRPGQRQDSPVQASKLKVEEESDMHVDDEEEKPPEADSEITREETKTLLKRCGGKYSDDNADRVYEDRLAGKHIQEDLTAKLAESNKQIQLLLKLNDKTKDDQAERSTDTHKIIEDSMTNQKAELLTEVAKLIKKKHAESDKSHEANNET